MKNIALVGFMGTGKTVISKKIARASGLEYISTDEKIVQKEGRPVNDIFEKNGESYFRDIERKVIREVSEMDNVAIDLGGGAVINPENVRDIKKKSVLVCLWATPEDIYKRTKRASPADRRSARPLLNVKEPLKKIEELLRKRKPYYEAADYHVNTSELSADEAVEAILKFVREYD